MAKYEELLTELQQAKTFPSHGYLEPFFNQIDLVFIEKSVLILLVG